MSKLWEVNCTGKSLPELKKALEGALRELEGHTSGGKAEFRMPPTPEIKEEEYVDDSEISNVHQMSQPNIAPAPVIDMNELDSKGMPWIKGLHSSSKAKVKDGTWKYARGTTDAQIIQAEAPYRGAVQQPIAPVQSVYQAPPMPPMIEPVFAQPQAPVQQQVAPVQPVYQAPPMPPQMPSGHTLQTFCANFPMIIGTLVQEGKINQDYINTLNAHFGVTQIWTITDEQKAAVFNDFTAWGLVKRVG